MTDRMGENGEVSSTPNAPPQQATQAWTVVASHGALVLGQSANEYAVYDQQNIFGRWPLTSEGYRYAVQTYESHQQSVAHGLAYTVTGYQDPARLGLPTEAVIKSKTYASPMSYVGSTRRIAAWMTKAAKRSPAYAVLAWVFGILAMLIMWVFLVFWYFVVFVLFGVFTFPYRFIRRSQRKKCPSTADGPCHTTGNITANDPPTAASLKATTSCTVAITDFFTPERSSIYTLVEGLDETRPKEMAL